MQEDGQRYVPFVSERLLEVNVTGADRKVPITLPDKAPDLPEDAPKNQQAMAVLTAYVEDLHVSASIDEGDNSIILKVVNISDSNINCELFMEDCQQLCGIVYEMAGFGKKAENSMDSPLAVCPEEKVISMAGVPAAYTFKPFSITVFRFKEVIG